MNFYNLKHRKEVNSPDTEDIEVKINRRMRQKEYIVAGQLTRYSNLLENKDIPEIDDNERYDETYSLDSWDEFAQERYSDDNLTWHYDEYANGLWNWL